MEYHRRYFLVGFVSSGVHFFRIRRQYNDDIRLKPERDVGVVLHYESPTFMGWATKFTNFREFDLKHNPMGFNKLSVQHITDVYEWYLDRVSIRSEDVKGERAPEGFILCCCFVPL